MLAKIKYTDLQNKNPKIIEVQIPCKPNLSDYIWINEIGKIEVLQVTIVSRINKDRNMKRPSLMITGRLVE